MTGVGGRPELVIEGSNNEDGPWKVCLCVCVFVCEHVRERE